jgi:hypothetical protein
MLWTEHCRLGRSSPPRPVMASVIAGVTALFASLLWLTVLPSTPAQGALLSATAAHAPGVDASGPAGTGVGGKGHAHKEGPVAVIASVLGVIAVVVLIVGLRSLSLKRRTRNGSAATDPDRGGPPGRERGLFDEWFRPRR